MVNTLLFNKAQGLHNAKNCPTMDFVDFNNDLPTFIQNLFNTFETELDSDRFQFRSHQMDTTPLDETLVITDMLTAKPLDASSDEDLSESIDELDVLEKTLLGLFTQQGITITENPNGYTFGTYHNNDGFHITYIRGDQTIVITRTWYNACLQNLRDNG